MLLLHFKSFYFSLASWKHPVTTNCPFSGIKDSDTKWWPKGEVGAVSPGAYICLPNTLADQVLT